jgi:hypothetical protein
MEEAALEQRRADAAEGTEFRVSANVAATSRSARSAAATRSCSRAVRWRGAIAGAGPRLTGIYQAMSTSRPRTGCRKATSESPISAREARRDHRRRRHRRRLPRHAIRQGAATIHQFEILPARPTRVETMPWPTYPMLYCGRPHEEGGERAHAVNTERFLGDDAGNVSGVGRTRSSRGLSTAA